MDTIVQIFEGIINFIFEYFGQIAGFFIFILIGILVVPSLLKIEDKIESLPNWLKYPALILYFAVGIVIICVI